MAQDAREAHQATAIPALLQSLDIAGNIITIDAMGRQKEIAKQIVNEKADYILALKGNQSKLHTQVKEWFESAKNNAFSGIEYSYHEQEEVGHQRKRKAASLFSSSYSITTSS